MYCAGRCGLGQVQPVPTTLYDPAPTGSAIIMTATQGPPQEMAPSGGWALMLALGIGAYLLWGG